MVLSWASSRIMTLYLFSSGSSMASRSSIPSVRNLILVLKFDMSSKRTVYPTVVPSWALISCATLVARVMAATLLGCICWCKLVKLIQFLHLQSKIPEWLQSFHLCSVHEWRWTGESVLFSRYQFLQSQSKLDVWLFPPTACKNNNNIKQIPHFISIRFGYLCLTG